MDVKCYPISINAIDGFNREDRRKGINEKETRLNTVQIALILRM